MPTFPRAPEVRASHTCSATVFRSAEARWASGFGKNDLLLIILPGLTRLSLAWRDAGFHPVYWVDLATLDTVQ